MDEYVERLYAALIDALRQSRSRPFGAPVTVAEIYQDLVPYRVVRSTIGFEMNADYEHALLELLAGVGGRARMEPEEAAQELRTELSSPNPNVGLFRKFAACDVWIADPGTDEDRFAPEAVDDEDDASTAARPGKEVLQLQSDDVVEERAAPAAPGSAERRSEADGRCGFCDARLPGGRRIRFCPHCGGDQTRRSCASCGELLESGWRFCVACGAPQEAERA